MRGNDIMDGRSHGKSRRRREPTAADMDNMDGSGELQRDIEDVVRQLVVDRIVPLETIAPVRSFLAEEVGEFPCTVFVLEAVLVALVV